MNDNYWSMGVPGPCGPCSEIYFDRGSQYGKDGGPIADEERYLEVWNLVFMQFERGADAGKTDYPILGELPNKNIDTGLGLERMAAILQGVENIYEIDTTKIILDKAVDLTGVKYGAAYNSDISLRVIADHARTAAMLICDGVTPGNEGRGYVLRRMMRRTIRNMRLLGSQEPVIKELIDAAIKAMGPQYPELVTDLVRIQKVAIAEEDSFLQTLKSGTQIFDVAASELKKTGSRTLSGDSAFKLHDTYGFPIDLTLEMASEQGLEVDSEGFRRLMKEQKERAKADSKAKKSGHTDLTEYRKIADEMGLSEFIGYQHIESEAIIRGLLVNGKGASSASEGDEIEVILDRTPFYAEGGGQLADGGFITLANGAKIEIDDVQAPVPSLNVHRGRVVVGSVELGNEAHAAIDLERRRAISRAHSATHMVHKAFREILGETATQAGSENSPGRFRFDFPSTGAVPVSVLNDVEARVNHLLLEDWEVTAEIMSQDEAKKLGAMALFGVGVRLKLGDTVTVDVDVYVRVCVGVDVGDFVGVVVGVNPEVTDVVKVLVRVGIVTGKQIGRAHV